MSGFILAFGRTKYYFPGCMRGSEICFRVQCDRILNHSAQGLNRMTRYASSVHPPPYQVCSAPAPRSPACAAAARHSCYLQNRDATLTSTAVATGHNVLDAAEKHAVPYRPLAASLDVSVRQSRLVEPRSATRIMPRKNGMGNLHQVNQQRLPLAGCDGQCHRGWL